MCNHSLFNFRYMYSGELDGVLALPGRAEDGLAQPAEKQDDAARCPLHELMQAAHKYLVVDLVGQCERWLLARLSGPEQEESVARLVGLVGTGYSLDCKPMRQVAYKYLKQHHERVLESQTWKDFAADERSLAADALLAAMTGREPPEPSV